jgi:hypothetical protein
MLAVDSSHAREDLNFHVSALIIISEAKGLSFVSTVLRYNISTFNYRTYEDEIIGHVLDFYVIDQLHLSYIQHAPV